MKNVNNRELGRQGERIAFEYLEGLGYDILDMNFFASHKEIDIIALDGERVIWTDHPDTDI
jgi:putative endonuclease